MQVVKNFGFTRPFIKTMQPGDYIRFADDMDSSAAQPRRSPSRLPLNRIQRVARIPDSTLTLNAFREWCRSMQDTWQEAADQSEARQGRHWRRFEQARAFARSLGLQSGAEWRRFSKGELTHLGRRPEDIPGCPERIYRDEGWVGYRDWLGIV